MSIKFSSGTINSKQKKQKQKNNKKPKTRKKFTDRQTVGLLTYTQNIELSFMLIIHKPMSTKLGETYVWVKEIQVSSNTGIVT